MYLYCGLLINLGYGINMIEDIINKVLLFSGLGWITYIISVLTYLTIKDIKVALSKSNRGGDK